jgi:hypothetical protein
VRYGLRSRPRSWGPSQGLRPQAMSLPAAIADHWLRRPNTTNRSAVGSAEIWQSTVRAAGLLMVSSPLSKVKWKLSPPRTRRSYVARTRAAFLVFTNVLGGLAWQGPDDEPTQCHRSV